MYLNRGGRDLLYLSRRVNGKPRKIYVGTGPLADLLAAELEGRKRARRERAEACASWKAKVSAAEGPLDVLCADLERLVVGHLLVLGYHRHDRGPWRKRRERPEVPTG